MDSEKIVREWDFLNEFERVFGQKAPYFMAYSVFESAKEAEIPEYIGLKKELEEAEHRAETFERMAFELGEELDAAKKYIEKNVYIGSCGACLYKDEDSNGKHCKNCTGRNSHFIFSAEKAREEG